VVEAFLRHHFQRFNGLRSLETLRHLHGPAALPQTAAAPVTPIVPGKDSKCPA
jgi:hypothetical protein